MMRLIRRQLAGLLLAALAAGPVLAQDAQPFTDATGRAVAIPAIRSGSLPPARRPRRCFTR